MPYPPPGQITTAGVGFSAPGTFVTTTPGTLTLARRTTSSRVGSMPSGAAFVTASGILSFGQISKAGLGVSAAAASAAQVIDRAIIARISMCSLSFP